MSESDRRGTPLRNIHVFVVELVIGSADGADGVSSARFFRRVVNTAKRTHARTNLAFLRVGSNVDFLTSVLHRSHECFIADGFDGNLTAINY